MQAQNSLSKEAQACKDLLIKYCYCSDDFVARHTRKQLELCQDEELLKDLDGLYESYIHIFYYRCRTRFGRIRSKFVELENKILFGIASIKDFYKNYKSWVIECQIESDHVGMQAIDEVRLQFNREYVEHVCEGLL